MTLPITGESSIKPALLHGHIAHGVGQFLTFGNKKSLVLLPLIQRATTIQSPS